MLFSTLLFDVEVAEKFLNLYPMFFDFIKTVTFVRRPKMNRDAGVKCCLFDSKKTAFHSSVSPHFWARNGRYGFNNIIFLESTEIAGNEATTHRKIQ